MGLWLVKQLVTRHGGTIDLENEAGKGARFTLIWPRRIPEEKPGERPATAEAGR
jgi:signal transduction histidine kinase